MTAQITEYTDPEVFTTGIDEGWADRETDPALIDWPARQASAAIPYQVVEGRPVSPFPPSAVQRGRNGFGRWAENLMADAIVTVTFAGRRYLLMVRRGDGRGWAVPGGAVEPGENGLEAAVRELAEETGLEVDARTGHVTPPRHVPDPRASDEAWAVTVAVVFDLGQRTKLPAVTGGDDADRAAWIQADDYDELVCWLGGEPVFAAHVPMLRDFLGTII